MYQDRREEGLLERGRRERGIKEEKLEESQRCGNLKEKRGYIRNGAMKRKSLDKEKREKIKMNAKHEECGEGVRGIGVRGHQQLLVSGARSLISYQVKTSTSGSAQR